MNIVFDTNDSRARAHYAATAVSYPSFASFFGQF